MRRTTLLIAAMALASCASAQTYPAKPIRFLVPYAPGGSTDVVARAVAAKIQESVGQPLLVENRPGAAEILATDLLAKAPPDGYTIALISNTFAINESFARQRPYESDKDFAAVGKLVDVPFAMLVSPGLPIGSVKDLVAYARANPGKMNYGHVGLGTPHYLTMEWFKRLAKIEAEGIGFKGTVPALTAVAQGDVHVITMGLGGATPFIRSGKVKPIASASARRLETLPDLPTIAEAGYADFELTSWFGVLTRSGTPPEVVDRLSIEVVKAITSPDLKERLAGLGLESAPLPAREFGPYIQREIERWGRVVQATGVKSE